MRIKKALPNSEPSPAGIPGPLPMEMLIFEKELDFGLRGTGKRWISSFKIESSSKIFEKAINGTATRGQSSSGRVTKVFEWMRVLLLIIGRFPFSPTVRSEGLGSPTFSYSLKTIHWLYFTITSLFLFFVFIMSTIGFVNYFLDWTIFPKTEYFESEQNIFKKNIVPFVLYWGCLLHVTIANLSCLTNRKKFVDYLNNWDIVVDVLDIDMPRSLRRFLFYSNLWALSFIGSFIIFFILDIAPIARAISALIENLSSRPFSPGIPHFQDDNLRASIFGLFTMLYGIYGSKALLFLYLFKSRLLRQSFKVWNRRLKDHIYLELNETDIFTEKILCEKLYRDHYILVKMVKQTDNVFGIMLQSYFATQILNMCFELYYLARSGSFDSDPSDIIVACALLAQTVSFFLTVSIDAAYVTEEAMKGFEILRSRGFRSDDSVNKKHLIYSLEMSYSQRIVLTGDKFFAVDRPFIVTVFGAVFTYFVIILQFGFGQTIDKDNELQTETEIPNVTATTCSCEL